MGGEARPRASARRRAVPRHGLGHLWPSAAARSSRLAPWLTAIPISSLATASPRTWSSACLWPEARFLVACPIIARSLKARPRRNGAPAQTTHHRCHLPTRPTHDNAELVAHPNAKHERVLTTKRDSFCAQLHTTLRSAPCAVDTETVGIGRKQDRQPKVCSYAVTDSSEEEGGS